MDTGSETRRLGVATSDSGLDLPGYHHEAARRLSAGTESAAVIWSPNIDGLDYYADARSR